MIWAAVNCQTGDALAGEQVTAGAQGKSAEYSGGEAASKLRGKLGRFLATVQRFDLPLKEATTSSLEALKAYSLALKLRAEKGSAASLQYAQRAIQLDPNFAEAYTIAVGVGVPAASARQGQAASVTPRKRLNSRDPGQRMGEILT